MTDLKPVPCPDEDRPPVVSGSPERIWLVYGDLDEDCNHDDLDEVTWCSEGQYTADVEYVRADVVAAALRERDELRLSLASANLQCQHYHAENEALTAERDELKADCERLRAALVRIRDIDYRGNRHESSRIAFAALTPSEKDKQT